MKYKVAVSVFIFVVFIFGVLCGYLITHRMYMRYEQNTENSSTYIQIINDKENLTSDMSIPKTRIEVGVGGSK